MDSVPEEVLDRVKEGERAMVLVLVEEKAKVTVAGMEVVMELEEEMVAVQEQVLAVEQGLVKATEQGLGMEAVRAMEQATAEGTVAELVCVLGAVRVQAGLVYRCRSSSGKHRSWGTS